VLREKVERFHADAEIQAALQGAMADRLAKPTVPAGGYESIRRETFDVDALAAPGVRQRGARPARDRLLLGVR
jgi:hypothetical protein